MASTLNGSQFTQLLVDQTPVFDKLILEDIRPEDGWILHVETGSFPAYSGVQHTLDRFNHVWPDITKAWAPTQAGNCLGTPCTKTENYISWGSTRLTYFLEEQSWATPLLCFDQEMHVTHAKEQFRQIITDILKPATSAINSNFLRKRVAQFTKSKWVANANFGTSLGTLGSSTANGGSAGMVGTFQYQWLQTSNADGSVSEAYIDTNTINTGIKMLTPQMLQRRVQPLMQLGYFGKQPFKDMPPLIELVTDLDTLWSLDHLGGSQSFGGSTGGATGSTSGPSVIGNWRFESWDATSKYWKYNFTGQIGNYAVRVDPFALRFNYVGSFSGNYPWGTTSYRYQVVLPYKNIPSSGAGSSQGLKDDVNPDYVNAQYRWSYIWHRKAVQCLMADASPVNPEMPYSSRNFGGKWQFVMDNLGVDSSGVAIENKRRNKGQFIADFKMAIRPQYTEFSELIMHASAYNVISEISTGVTDPGTPTQYYSSAPANCSNTSASYTLTLHPTMVSNILSPFYGGFYIPDNGTLCNGDPLETDTVGGDPANLLNTLPKLVADMNAKLGALGISNTNTPFAVASTSTLPGTITSFASSAAAAGSTVTVVGTGFTNTAQGNSVVVTGALPQGPTAVASISGNGTTVTVTTSVAHGLFTSEIVSLSGFTSSAFNIPLTTAISISSPTVFTFANAANATTSTGLVTPVCNIATATGTGSSYGAYVAIGSATATINTTQIHGLTSAANQQITISGSTAPFNGTFNVTSATSNAIVITLPAAATATTQSFTGSVLVNSIGYNGVFNTASASSTTGITYVNLNPVSVGNYAGGSPTFQNAAITYTGTCSDLEIPWASNA